MTRHTRRFAFFRREREPILLGLLCVAAGGALAYGCFTEGSYRLLRRAFT